MPAMNDRDFRIFLAGFACSREGFNGEFAHIPLAPDRDELQEQVTSLARADSTLVEEMRRLYAALFPDDQELRR